MSKPAKGYLLAKRLVEIAPFTEKGLLADRFDQRFEHAHTAESEADVALETEEE